MIITEQLMQRVVEYLKLPSEQVSDRKVTTHRMRFTITSKGAKAQLLPRWGCHSIWPGSTKCPHNSLLGHSTGEHCLLQQMEEQCRPVQQVRAGDR